MSCSWRPHLSTSKLRCPSRCAQDIGRIRHPQPHCGHNSSCSVGSVPYLDQPDDQSLLLSSKTQSPHETSRSPREKRVDNGWKQSKLSRYRWKTLHSPFLEWRRWIRSSNDKWINLTTPYPTPIFEHFVLGTLGMLYTPKYMVEHVKMFRNVGCGQRRLSPLNVGLRSFIFFLFWFLVLSHAVDEVGVPEVPTDRLGILRRGLQHLLHHWRPAVVLFGYNHLVYVQNDNVLESE